MAAISLGTPGSEINSAPRQESQKPGADPYERLPSSVHKHEYHEGDPTDLRRRTLDAAQEQIDRNTHQRDEDQHPEVDHKPRRELVTQVRVRDRFALPRRMEQQEHGPSEWHADQEGE